MKKLAMFLVFVMTGCASFKDETLQTMDDKERPQWATLSKTITADKGKLYAVGYTEGAASNRISALMRISDNNARFEFAREITNQMNFIYQNLEEGVSEGGQLSRFYGTEISKLMAHGIRQENRYWEKVRTFNEDGDPVIRLRIYSKVSIKQSDLKKAIREAINNKKQITKAIKEKIDNHMIAEVDKMMD